MALSDILYSKMTRPYLDATLADDSDDSQARRDDWVQFIRDYLPWLRARAMVVNVSETVMPNVRFNLRRYMLQKGIESQLWWIVLEMNNFRNDMDFDRNRYPREGDDNDDVYMQLLLPVGSDVDTLYDLWRTSSQNSSARSSLVNTL